MESDLANALRADSLSSTYLCLGRIIYLFATTSTYASYLHDLVGVWLHYVNQLWLMVEDLSYFLAISSFPLIPEISIHHSSLGSMATAYGLIVDNLESD